MKRVGKSVKDSNCPIFAGNVDVTFNTGRMQEGLDLVQNLIKETNVNKLYLNRCGAKQGDRQIQHRDENVSGKPPQLIPAAKQTALSYSHKVL